LEKLRVAIGSNDGERIVSGHMGDAEYFYVHDIFRDGEARLVGRRENTSSGDEKGHGKSEKRKAVLEILKDVDILVGGKISPNFKKIAVETPVQPVVSELEDIEEILSAMSNSFDRFQVLVQRRRDGERFEEIPTLKRES